MNARQEFLRAVLGAAGAEALGKAVARAPVLEAALLPRAALAWVALAARVGYEGPVPGSNVSISLTKNEAGHTGQLGDTKFTNETIYRVAARVAVALGCGGDASAVKGLQLQKLGKSIDLLAKAQLVSELQKRVLDPSLGYTFKVQHQPAAGPAPAKTVVSAHTPSGEQVGYATMHHNPTGQLEPFGVGVEDEHQRRGIASHMYRVAEQATGKKVVPSKTQTDEGAALWGGNAQTQQFGKVELPGQAAPPAPQGGPLEPTPPTRQQAAPPKPTKPKLPKPSAPKLRMSEKDLTHTCATCGGKNLVKSGRLAACLCWRDLASDLQLEKSDPGYLVSFGGRWDEEARSAFTAEFRSQQSQS